MPVFASRRTSTLLPTGGRSCHGLISLCATDSRSWHWLDDLQNRSMPRQITAAETDSVRNLGRSSITRNMEVDQLACHYQYVYIFIVSGNIRKKYLWSLPSSVCLPSVLRSCQVLWDDIVTRPYPVHHFDSPGESEMFSQRRMKACLQYFKQFTSDQERVSNEGSLSTAEFLHAKPLF